MDMGKPVTANAMRFSPDGKVELLFDGKPLIPNNAYCETSYDRKKNPKILNKIGLNPNNLVNNQNITLQKFDVIFAVDTNTKKINNVDISVCGLVFCTIHPIDKNSINYKYAPIKYFEFRGIKEKYENVAWVEVIEFIMNNPKLSNKKIGLVVDSDLGNIPDYNQNILPIYSNFYLPSNIEIIYASADAGKEYILNKLISVCDKEASLLLNKIIKEKNNNSDLHQVNNKPFTHFRLWQKTVDQFITVSS